VSRLGESIVGVRRGVGEPGAGFEEELASRGWMGLVLVRVSGGEWGGGGVGWVGGGMSRDGRGAGRCG
jgi:hypothetical protein